MNANKNKHKQQGASKYLMGTPPVEEIRDATIARRAQLRRSIFGRLNAQQTNVCRAKQLASQSPYLFKKLLKST